MKHSNDQKDNAINVPNIFVAPRGSRLPDESHLRAVEVFTIRDVCTAMESARDELPVVLVFSDMDLLSVVIKYADLFPLTASVLAGITSGEYDVMFENVTFPLDKVSYPIFEAELTGRRERPVERTARDVAASVRSASVNLARSNEQFGPSADEEDAE